MSNNRVSLTLQLGIAKPVLTVNEDKLSLECGIADLLKGLDQSMEFLVYELGDKGYLEGIYANGFEEGQEELKSAIDEDEGEYGPRIGTIKDSPEDIDGALSSKQCRDLCTYLIERGYGPEKEG